MPTLTLRHQQATASGFVATLSVDGQSQYPVTVADPFTEQQEREIENALACCVLDERWGM